MKACPFCAEQIQDDAIKCRYCGSMLTTGEPGAETAAGEPAPDPASTMALDSAGATGEFLTPDTAVAAAPSSGSPGFSASAFSHSGYRYLLGYTPDAFGIWDREQPGSPLQTFPRTQEGWSAAWQHFAASEPSAVPVGGAAGMDQAAQAGQTGQVGIPGQTGTPVSGMAKRTNGSATAALVLGILGAIGSFFIFGAVLSILALVLGYTARGEIDRSQGTQEGRGNAVAGIVLGWVGIGIAIIFTIIVIVSVNTSPNNPFR